MSAVETALLLAVLTVSVTSLGVLLRRTDPRPRPRKVPPVPRRTVTPEEVAADPLLGDIAAMLAYLYLHVGKYQEKQFTTEQKELWADLIDADHVNRPDDGEDPWLIPRWWRDDYVEDPDRP